MADETDGELEAMFAEARYTEVPPALSARVLADAERVIAKTPVLAAPRQRRGWWREPPGIVSALGGWGGFAGVATAGVAGLAIGLGAPGAVERVGADLLPASFLTEAGSGWTPDLALLALGGGDV